MLSAFVGVHEHKLEKVVSVAKQKLSDVRFELLSGFRKANLKSLFVLPSKSFDMYELNVLSRCIEHKLEKVVSVAKQKLWHVRFEPLSGA